MQDLDSREAKCFDRLIWYLSGNKDAECVVFEVIMDRRTCEYKTY